MLGGKCSLRVTLGLAHVTQVLLYGKVSLTSAAAAETGHFLFPLSVSGVLPGQLGACLHNTEGEKTHIHLSTYPEQQTQPSSSSSSSPVGEKGDDGEGRVMGVCEDVLKEQVWVATML